LCGGVLTPPSIKEVGPARTISRMWLLRRVRHLALRNVVLLTLQSLSRLSLAARWFLLVDGVAKSILLPMVSRVVVAREIYDFLATLVVAYPRSVVG
jgi:hypothetical protein